MKNKDELLNKRIKYTRSGHRLGWLGTIINITHDRVLVQYDNGVQQDYRLDAVDGFSSFKGVGYGSYLKLITDSLVQPVQPQPPMPSAPLAFQATTQAPKVVGEFLAVKFDGSVMESFGDEDEALQFCLEQIQSGSKFEKFHVFHMTKTVITDKPRHVLLSSVGEVM